MNGSQVRGQAMFLVASLTAVIALSGCTFSGINLVEDTRVTIVSPDDGEHVRLPITLRWTTHHLDTSPGSDMRFAVFVDTKPIMSGETLRAVAEGDGLCLRDPKCPGPEYLSSRGVYVVDDTSFTIGFLPDLRSEHQDTDTHRFVVVILNGDRRDGEGSFSRTVYVDRSRA